VAIDLIADPHGDIEGDGGAAIRPDGSVWLLASDATRAPRVVDQDGRDVLPSRADASPPGRPFRSFVFSKPERRPDPRVRGDPAGAGTVPDRDVGARRSRMARTRSLRPETQAFVDAGYAVALVNYRGSTGYGVAFRRSLIGAVCFTETEDIIAGLDALEREGVVDPRRVYWSGWSWGGCLACFNAGVHPDRWRAIFAGIPSGDFVAAHHACAPELQPGTTPSTAAPRRRSPTHTAGATR